MMKFFTPELYLRYNAPDDAEADRADEEWERTLRAYQDHLARCSQDMNDRVKDLAADLCLHDAELLSIREDVPGPLPGFPFSPIPVATLLLDHGGTITNLVYFLWSEIELTPAMDEWPQSKRRAHWLYDEIDVERHPPYITKYWHKILCSNGQIVSIPFFDVMFQAVSPGNFETEIVIKKRA